MRSGFQHRAQERLVTLVETKEDLLTERTEPVALDVVAQYERQGPFSRAALAAHRKGSPVHGRERLDERVQRDRIFRVFFGEFHESDRERCQTRLNLFPFLGGPGLRRSFGSILAFL